MSCVIEGSKKNKIFSRATKKMYNLVFQQAGLLTFPRSSTYENATFEGEYFVAIDLFIFAKY